jgi:hypothetical protein
MTIVGDEICALCGHFKMKEYPQHAKVGLGRCMGYDGKHEQLSNPFVNWNTKACKRYARPANKAEREAWVEKRLAKEKQPVVQTEKKGNE